MPSSASDQWVNEATFFSLHRKTANPKCPAARFAIGAGWIKKTGKKSGAGWIKKNLQKFGACARMCEGIWRICFAVKGKKFFRTASLTHWSLHSLTLTIVGDKFLPFSIQSQ